MTDTAMGNTVCIPTWCIREIRSPPPLVELRVLFLFVCKSGKYRPPSIIPLVSFWRNYVPISGVGEWLLRPAFWDRWLLPWTKRQLPAHAFFLFWSIVSVISKRAYCDWVIRLRSRRRMTGTAAISQCLQYRATFARSQTLYKLCRL